MSWRRAGKNNGILPHIAGAAKSAARLPEGKINFARKALKPPEADSPPLCYDDIAINCLQGRGKIHQLHRSSIAKGLTMAPRKIRVNIDDKTSERPPIIHWTACERFRAVADYRPAALRGVSFRVMGRDGKVGKKIIDGIAGLRREK